MQGVILAAGRGHRLKPLSDELPKPLLPVLDRSILQWQLEVMASIGISDAVVVVGPHSKLVKDELARCAPSKMTIRYSTQASPSGIADALLCAKSEVSGPFLLFLGDIYFESSRLREMVDSFLRSGIDAMIGAREEQGPDAVSKNFSVEVTSDGQVTRVEEKPPTPRSRLKGCGVYAFRPDIFRAALDTPPSALRGERELTDAIQRLIDTGGCVRAAPIIDDDVNVSFAADVIALNIRLLRRRNLSRYIATGAVVPASARIHDSVILEGARIGEECFLDSCIALPGASIPPGVRRRNVIFARSGEISSDTTVRDR